MKALIFGNCQIPVLAKCMRTMNSNLQIEQIRTTAASSDLHHLRERFRATDKIFVMTTATDRFSELFVENSEKVLRFPRIYFPAYHPDIVHLCLAGKLVHTPLSYYNSKLVLAGFLQGLTVDETRALFTGDVFKKVGYLDAWGPSVAMFRRETRDTIFEMMDAPVKWSRSGCFMYTINRPKLPVMVDVAQALLNAAGLEIRTSHPERYIHDDLMKGPIWPIYPEIAAAYGIEGDYSFKASEDASNINILSLAEFVEKSFAAYSSLDTTALEGRNFDIKAFCNRLFDGEESQADREELKRETAESKTDHADPGMRPLHPYSSLKPYQVWRKSVSSLPTFDVDPVVSTPFRIGRQSRQCWKLFCPTYFQRSSICGSQLLRDRNQACGYAADGSRTKIVRGVLSPLWQCLYCTAASSIDGSCVRRLLAP